VSAAPYQFAGGLLSERGPRKRALLSIPEKECDIFLNLVTMCIKVRIKYQIRRENLL